MSEVLDTITLLGLRTRVMQRFDPIFLKRFFPHIMTFHTETIALDEIETDVVLAPLVSPLVNGKVIEQKGAKMIKLKPAYVKPKHRVDPSKTIKRTAGEAIGGSLNPGERRNLIRAQLVNTQEDMILYREEWLAVQAILYGKVLLEGPEYPTQVVDYERNPANTILLSLTEKWSKKGPDYDPTPDFEEWSALSSDIATDVLMSKSVWGTFRKFKVVQDLIKKDSGSKSNGEMGPRASAIFQHKMTFGDFEIFVYDGKYKDAEQNQRFNFIPKHGMVFAPPEGTSNGTMAYGAIMDVEANDEGIVAAARWPKNWTTKEPSAEYIRTDSAPLAVPDDPDRYVYVNVEGMPTPY